MDLALNSTKSMECLKGYSAKACFVLTRGVGWKLPTFATHYTTYWFVLFSPPPTRPVVSPDLSSPPPPASHEQYRRRRPSLHRPAGRTAGDAGNEPPAAPSASSSQFWASSWPSPSSSNPRRLGCQWCGGRRRREGKRGSWRCLGELNRSVFARIWRGRRPRRRRGWRHSRGRSWPLGQGRVWRCARRGRRPRQGHHRRRPSQGHGRRPGHGCGRPWQSSDWWLGQGHHRPRQGLD
jgi:hypothetical protein